MRKKRTAERKRASHFFGVYHRKTDKYIGKLVDMSTRGMKVLSKKPIQTHTIYEFRIELPKAVAGYNEIYFDAQCVWSAGSSEENEQYDSGFQITGIDFDQIEAIQYLLSDDLFTDPDIQPRFTLEEKPSK